MTTCRIIIMKKLTLTAKKATFATKKPPLQPKNHLCNQKATFATKKPPLQPKSLLLLPKAHLCLPNPAVPTLQTFAAAVHPATLFSVSAAATCGSVGPVKWQYCQ